LLEQPDVFDPRVVLASPRLAGPLRASLDEACASARVRCVLWDQEQPIPSHLRPSLVVSSLGLGERRIGDDLVRLMTQEHPGLALLLLCQDELIRPTISLQEGRVTLLGPALTTERISARLRILLADHAGAPSGTLQFGIGTSARVLVREQSTPRIYCGLAASSGLEESVRDVAPVVNVSETGALNVFLNVAGSLPTEQYLKASEVIASEENDKAKEDALILALGASTAMIHYSASGEWAMHWPLPHYGLHLASAARIPETWSFSNSLGRTECTFTRSQGATGDVLLAVWGTTWPQDASSLQRFLDAARVGGPRVLDYLSEFVGEGERAMAGLVMEVR
jgi:hypothetical protein